MRSRKCSCSDGASTFPNCGKQSSKEGLEEGSTNANATANCDELLCTRFEHCPNGKCECKYGKDRGRCRRCEQRCRRNEKCRKRGSKYECVCRYGSFRSGRCKPKPLKCGKYCGPDSTCGRKRGHVVCFSCSKHSKLVDGMCVKLVENKWTAWGSWTACENRNHERTKTCPKDFRCIGGKNKESEKCCRLSTGKITSMLFYHPQPLNRFGVICTGGCIQVIKATHCNRDELKRVKDICEGQSQCTIRPSPAFFGQKRCDIKETSFLS